MKRDVFAKGFGAAAMFILSAGFVSCDVHEWIEPEAEEQVTLNLVFETEFADRYYDYAASAATRAERPAVEMDYIARAYPVVNGVTDTGRYKEVSFSRSVGEDDDYDCETAIGLAPGEYHIIVWSEFRVGGTTYYNTDDFAKITVNAYPYTGDTDYRKAYRGSLNVVVKSPGNAAGGGVSATVEMSSPMARYIFVATDLERFLDAEREKAGGNVALGDYYVIVSYPQFMPSAYNLFNHKPNDSLTGISFSSTLEDYSEGKASLGFDYVFVNGSESKVLVQMTVYRKSDNKEVSRTPQIMVPVYRGVNTIVEGAFLSSQSKDGVGLDPSFSGDIDIYF